VWTVGNVTYSVKQLDTKAYPIDVRPQDWRFSQSRYTKPTSAWYSVTEIAWPIQDVGMSTQRTPCTQEIRVYSLHWHTLSEALIKYTAESVLGRYDRERRCR
jgi:hypothetical protein